MSAGERPILLRQGELGEQTTRRGLSFPESDVVSRCGKTYLTVDRGRLTAINASADISGEPGVRYSSVACAPNGQLLVAVRDEPGSGTSMVVLRRDGTPVEEVAQQSTIEDAPMWGPSGTGVVFVGDVGGDGAVGPLV